MLFVIAVCATFAVSGTTAKPAAGSTVKPGNGKNGGHKKKGKKIDTILGHDEMNKRQGNGQEC